MNLQKLNEKLLQKFLDSTKSIKNKRIVEHSLNDMLQVILVILVIIGVVCTINFSGWGLVIFYIIYALVLYGYIAMCHAVRVLVLNVLYPEGETDEEIQENHLNNLFTQIDTLIKQLNED